VTNVEVAVGMRETAADPASTMTLPQGDSGCSRAMPLSARSPPSCRHALPPWPRTARHAWCVPGSTGRARSWSCRRSCRRPTCSTPPARLRALRANPDVAVTNDTESFSTHRAQRPGAGCRSARWTGSCRSPRWRRAAASGTSRPAPIWLRSTSRAPGWRGSRCTQPGVEVLNFKTPAAADMGGVTG